MRNDNSCTIECRFSHAKWCNLMLRWFLYGSLLCLVACGASQQTTPQTAESEYQKGLKELKKHHCLKAAEVFQRVVTSWPGSDIVDDAQYHLGEAHLCAKEYTEAIFEYERLIREYRNSPYVDDAALKIGICYYKESLPVPLDQKDTYNAIDHLTRFLEDYPESPLCGDARQYLRLAQTKLAEKTYRTAEFYKSRGDDESALIYYQEAIARYGETTWAPYAAFGTGEIFLQQGKGAEALQMFKKASEGATDQILKKQAIKRVAELEDWAAKNQYTP